MSYVILSSDDIRLKYVNVYGVFDKEKDAFDFLEKNVESSYDDTMQYMVVEISEPEQLIEDSKLEEDEEEDW